MSGVSVATRRLCGLGLLLVVWASGCKIERTGGERGGNASHAAQPREDAAARARYRTAGDPCVTVADCPALPGARCLAWPDGYCTAPCYPDGACDEGICADAAGLGLGCLRECASDRECRPGYRCEWTIDGQVCAPAE